MMTIANIWLYDQKKNWSVLQAEHGVVLEKLLAIFYLMMYLVRRS